MDDTDYKILFAVNSGVVRYTSLAKKLGIPVSTVHFRMKKLEKSKVIRRYVGDIDWAACGFPIISYVFVNIDVDLLKKMRKTQEMLLKELLGLAYVVEGHVITGEADILLKIISRDTGQLKDILLNHIDSKDGVVKTKTAIVLE
jgi:DNA-binding Lrp family transcriptional regulator